MQNLKLLSDPAELAAALHDRDALIIGGCLRYVESVLLGIYALQIFTCGAYHWAEVVNISCWIDFNMQMKVYHDAERFDNSMIAVTRRKEIWFIIVFVIAVVGYLLPAIGLTVAVYVNV